jgi:hypothetical protein
MDEKKGSETETRSATYLVSVRGELGAATLGAFPALSAACKGGITVLSGALSDQAALYGVLGQVEALGLELLEVRRMT